MDAFEMESETGELSDHDSAHTTPAAAINSNEDQLESQVQLGPPELPIPDFDDDTIIDLNTTGAVNTMTSDQVRALLSEETQQRSTSESKTRRASTTPDVPIKQEFQGFGATLNSSVPGEVIDISDSEEVVIKEEDKEDPFNWTSMPDDMISLSDSDEDLAGDDSDSVIELGAENEANQILAPRQGRSVLTRQAQRSQRKPSSVASLLAAQRKLEEETHARDFDTQDDSWMNSDGNFDIDAAAKFKALKSNYRAKERRNTNTIEDDFAFQRAEKAEKSRLKRLELDYLASRGDDDSDNEDDDYRNEDEDNDYLNEDEDDESDEDSLFVSSGPSRKRRRAAPAKTAEKETGSSPAPKKRRSNPPRLQDPASLQEDFEMNLMAGIEGYLRKDRKKQTNEKSDAKGKRGQKASEKSKKTGKQWVLKDQRPSQKKKRPTQVGYLSNARSLLKNNVFETAKANRSLAPLPVSTETNKTKALAAMVANIPIGEIRQRRAEKAHIKRATVTLGKRRVNPDGNGAWKLSGMKSSLRHHQVQGAAWMKERELGEDQPFGGIVADGMGLGKTVMAVAVCIANPPTRQDKYKATLIVCTPALLKQWEREIFKHAADDTFRRVIFYCAGCRPKGKGAMEDLQKADIVLTTYNEVMRSYPKAEIPEEVDSSEKLQKWWTKIWEEDREMLHKARFYRVILDESQAIKNHLSHTSVACRALMAKHRWALSGTPIMNRVEELYPYFKYLRVEYTGSYSEFTQHFCIEGNSDCSKRLHCILDQIMIRRTMDDKVLGHPIVSLPETHQATERVDFNDVERIIYQIVSRRFIRAINKASANGKLDQKPGYGITMFLRLRQMAAHIFLIQDILQEMFGMDSIDRIEAATTRGVITNENKPARVIIDALRRMVAAKGEIPEVTPGRQSEEMDSPTPGDLVTKLRNHLIKLRDKSKFEELKAAQLCQKCGNIAEIPFVTSCLHVYCKECLEFLACEAAMNDQDRTPCRVCGTRYNTTEPCSGLKELAIDDFGDLSPDLKSRKSNNGKVNMCWVAYDDELVMSAKVIGVESQIERWLEEDPNKKIIVFSQFLMVMSILEKMCQRKDWAYCNYNGKMSHQSRDKAIANFGKKDSTTKILIASLKCGGIGLNLTMASRVTCVDLWFNSCMEQQAFCRVWRIGQEDETFVTRFIVNDTVDDRLEQMQKHKEVIVGGAIDDRSVTSKLSLQEVMRLFGDVHFDKRTKKPFIALDDDERLDAILSPVPDDQDDPIAWRK